MTDWLTAHADVTALLIFGIYAAGLWLYTQYGCGYGRIARIRYRLTNEAARRTALRLCALEGAH